MARQGDEYCHDPKNPRTSRPASTSTTFTGSIPCAAPSATSTASLSGPSTRQNAPTAGLFFEPVSDEAHAEPLLHLAIAQVSLRDVGSRQHPEGRGDPRRAASGSNCTPPERTDSAASSSSCRTRNAPPGRLRPSKRSRGSSHGSHAATQELDLGCLIAVCAEAQYDRPVNKRGIVCRPLGRIPS